MKWRKTAEVTVVGFVVLWILLVATSGESVASAAASAAPVLVLIPAFARFVEWTRNRYERNHGYERWGWEHPNLLCLAIAAFLGVVTIPLALLQTDADLPGAISLGVIVLALAWLVGRLVGYPLARRQQRR
jgi:hypothetical protein